MRILIAEDDSVSRRLLEVLLERWEHKVVSCADGTEAWVELQKPDHPRLAILDWMMPEIDGIDLCRRIRRLDETNYVYVILLTAREERADVIAGFEAGADDYLTKPFDHEELRFRIHAAERILSLKDELADKVVELQDALDHVKQLQGIMPICMHCHKIRDEGQIWHRLEEYIQTHSEAVFTHALCDDCLAKYYPEVTENQDDEIQGPD
ncbi:MAG TPA: response regulator [Myxococcota bacterium]|nr:response regulator [Myxococcota bacterium]